MVVYYVCNLIQQDWKLWNLKSAWPLEEYSISKKEETTNVSTLCLNHVCIIREELKEKDYVRCMWSKWSGQICLQLAVKHCLLPAHNLSVSASLVLWHRQLTPHLAEKALLRSLAYSHAISNTPLLCFC